MAGDSDFYSELASLPVEVLARNLRLRPEYVEGVLKHVTGSKRATLEDLLGNTPPLPEKPQIRPPEPKLEPPPQETTTALIDPELARVAVALGHVPIFRVWAYAHGLSRAAGGVGWCWKSELFDTLNRLGVVTAKRTFDHLLQSGAGLYWTLGLGRAADGSEQLRVHLTGYVALSERLTSLALDTLPAIVATNKPGSIKYYVDLSGSLSQATAQIYNAWLALRDHRTISRDTLTALWQKTANTLREYERAAGVQKHANYAQHHATTGNDLPPHAYLCQNTEGDNFTAWQLPNTYTAAPAKEHPHKGNSSKARKAANTTMDAQQPVANCGDGLPVGRIYFVFKHSATGSLSPFKQVQRHLKQHHDLDRRHYARLGATRRGVALWELTTGDHLTMLGCRDYRKENTPPFQQQRHAYNLSREYRC